jgi:uncharacterized protein YihD (DUF1040 family)
MAELTPEDRDNYGKLKDAIDQIENNTDNSKIISAVKNLVKQPELVKSTEELSEIVEKLSSYWQVSSNLETPIKFKKIAGKPDFEQQFSDAIENLKRSLKVVEDKKIDLTDEIEDFQPDSLFLEFIPNGTNGDPQKWTKTLINDRDPNLDSGQIDRLTQSWGTAVSKFVEDARKPKPGGEVEPGQPDTFAHFFRIHKELEILYSRLADTETVQSSR